MFATVPCLPAGASAMIEVRITKIVMVASLALFALLVTFDNLTDYDTNYAFVRHVLSMDTTFPGNELLYRRITSRGAVRHCPCGRNYLSCLASAL
jgi:predicted small integral membrane protein